ncbi:Hemerythrin-like domain-containing protein [Marinobacter sp. LV10R510-11A]|uniref:hemerythrin domain-containing protein n=1 Tax=Marinobacter sp. LV10R510-11A TaxID=1415568 RepID=UPI000BB850B2|nr:hemerythrin domain-containing protein [Marinobacter sp. LV10R510-11A]SOB74904.1 Hemerythrin-like domain-containing protein [Marinobacter sp. LV10R510-11A]
MATFNQLRRDHVNMARLLHVLLLRHTTLEQGERPDFHLIREIVDYILEYMDGFIMPLERLYSEHLLAKEPDAEALSRQMAEDYQALRKRLDLLSKNVDMILMDAVVPMDRFAADLKAYLDAHRAYLQVERDQLFPFLRKHLTDAEQKDLLKMLPGGAQANLSRLREDHPELYAEFKAAPSPFA